MRDPRTFLIVAVFGALTALAPPVRAQDPMPEDAVMFFNLSGCPPDWAPFPQAFQRLIVPMAHDIGMPVPPSPMPGPAGHFHKFSSTVTLPPVGYALAPGCSANCLSAAGSHPFFGETGGESGSLPLLFLFACIKVAAPTSTGSIPPGLMGYFYRPRNCLPGWTQVIEASGRILVGLPGQGTPGAPFGGPPLSSGEDRKHAHRITGSLTTYIQPMAGLAGSWAEGHGAHGAHPYSFTTEESSSYLGYLQLLLCRKD